MTTVSRPHRLASTLLASMLPFAVLPVSMVQADDTVFQKFPVLIQCKLNETYHAFYISRVSQAGIATYVASERIGGTITLDGKAKAVGVKGGGSCVGKTLNELRASGQAFDLKP